MYSMFSFLSVCLIVLCFHTFCAINSYSSARSVHSLHRPYESIVLPVGIRLHREAIFNGQMPLPFSWMNGCHKCTDPDERLYLVLYFIIARLSDRGAGFCASGTSGWERQCFRRLVFLINERYTFLREMYQTGHNGLETGGDI